MPRAQRAYRDGMTAAGDTWPENIEVRPVGGGEIEAFLDVFETAWGFTPDGEQRRRTGAVVAGESLLGAFADDGMAGTVMSFALELTVPGQVQMPMAGVSYVAVHPLRRRRGIMRELMRYQFDELHARGVPVAGLGPARPASTAGSGTGPLPGTARGGWPAALPADWRTGIAPAAWSWWTRPRRWSCSPLCMSKPGGSRWVTCAPIPADGMTLSAMTGIAAGTSCCAGMMTGVQAGTRSTG